LKLRLEADNPGFILRPDMFVDVELPVAKAAGLAVPADAVIDSGREQRVFVERSPGVFEPRNVQAGWRFGDRIEIVKGLSEGERVVSEGTFLVDSESRLKSAPAPKEEQQQKLSPKSAAGTSMSAHMVKDAACGMTIDASKATAEGHTITRDGVTYYFCSDRCKRKFSEQPDHALAANSPEPRS
jgi:YHS domain-containing protein